MGNRLRWDQIVVRPTDPYEPLVRVADDFRGALALLSIVALAWLALVVLG